MCICLTAIIAMITFNSCNKEINDEYKNQLTINGENVSFKSISIEYDDKNDGVTIVPDIGENYPLGSLVIQFSQSLIGTKIDLSILDVYAETIALHYVHSVYFDKEDEEEHFYLTWGGDFETELADKGSYIYVQDLGESDYQIDMYCKSKGYEVKLYYKGRCDESR